MISHTKTKFHINTVKTRFYKIKSKNIEINRKYSKNKGIFWGFKCSIKRKSRVFGASSLILKKIVIFACLALAL